MPELIDLLSKRLVGYLKLVGFLVLGLLTGYFVFLLILKFSGNYENWKRYIKEKHKVDNIWKF